MKTTGIVKKVDKFGHVKIRHQLYKALGIEDNKIHLEILVEDE